MDLQKYIQDLHAERKIEKPFEKTSDCVFYCINILNKLVFDKSGGKNGLILNENNEHFFQQLFAYLNKDFRVEEINTPGTSSKWDIDKGLFLVGGYGVGKTLILEFLRHVKSKFDIPGIHTTAYVITKEYAAQQQDSAYMGYQELLSCKNLFIDEVGDEPKVSKSYGNEENVMYRTLKLKLDKIEAQAFPKDKIFMTSNLGSKELTERYGDRIMDRIKGSMNVIVFDPKLKSYRN